MNILIVGAGVTCWAADKRPDISANESPSDSMPEDWDEWIWAEHEQAEGLVVDTTPEAGAIIVWP